MRGGRCVVKTELAIRRRMAKNFEKLLRELARMEAALNGMLRD